MALAACATATLNRNLVWAHSRLESKTMPRDVGIAVWRLEHITNSGRSDDSTARHDAMLTAASLSHAGNAETE